MIPNHAEGGKSWGQLTQNLELFFPYIKLICLALRSPKNNFVFTLNYIFHMFFFFNLFDPLHLNSPLF